MISKEYIENSLIPSYIENIIQRLTWLKTGEGVREKIYDSFKGFFMNLAICKMILEHDQSEIKLLLSYAAMVYDRRLTIEGETYLSLQNLMYLSFSENQSILNRLSQKSNIDLSKDTNGWLGEIQAFYNIIDGDWKALSATTQHLRNINGAYHKLFFPEIHFKLYKGFIKQDQVLIEQSINELILENKKVNRRESIPEEKYVSFGVLSYVKQAYKYGMPIWKSINIETLHDYLIPQGWLDYTPLSEYTISLKFLRDFYRRQNIDWRYAPIYPELQDWENDPENPLYL